MDNAISLQGGTDYFRNVNIGSSNEFELALVFDDVGGFATEVNDKLTGIRTYETNYNVSIKFNKAGSGYKVENDAITYKCEFVKLELENEKIKEKEGLGSGEIEIRNVHGKIETRLTPPKDLPIKEEDILGPSFSKGNLSNRGKLGLKELLLESRFLSPFMSKSIFSDISIYDFDPKLPKRAVPFIGKTTLEEDGSNLAIVLKSIKQNAVRRRKFLNFIKELLPFVEDFGVDKFADTLLLKLREAYSSRHFLPASLLSDGTINIISLIIALYFERKSLKIIEEPERNIHPYLMSRIVKIMQEASRKTQIITTTHNPEIVKYVNLNDILLVSRDKSGFSSICRPSEKNDVKTFLKNEMGIEDLFIHNLLSI